MSELQLALLVIGALLVGGVFAYNRWQEARLRKRSDQAFGSRHEDVLLEPRSPGDDPDASRGAEPAWREPGGSRVEHTMEAEPPVPAAPGTPEAPHSPAGGVLDPRVDYIVEIDLPRAVAGADIGKYAAALVDEGLVKPVYWEAAGVAPGAWAPLAREGSYSRIRAGLQLASRSGPVTIEDLGAFVAGVQELSLQLSGQADFPDTDEALAQAVALDRFCADVDVQIGLHVVAEPGGTIPGTKIRALAESAGLGLARDGRFHRLDEQGAEVFALANIEPMPFHAETLKTLATRGVTALLDVPRVAGGGGVQAYIDFVRALERALGGTIVDDNSQPVGDAGLETIRAQLQQIHRTMAERGIPAGSAVALRLFA